MADLKAPRPGAAAAEASSLTTTVSKGGGEKSASSGFVLKLFQMVNGAPDDILSVSLQISFISIVLLSPTCLVGVRSLLSRRGFLFYMISDWLCLVFDI
jgi:hypothetical protein